MLFHANFIGSSEKMTHHYFNYQLKSLVVAISGAIIQRKEIYSKVSLN